MDRDKPAIAPADESTEAAEASETQASEAESPTPPSASPAIPDILPVLPLRGGTVIFPLAVVPLLVGQDRSIRLIDDVMRSDRLVALVAQKPDAPEQAGPDDLYHI